MIDKTKLIEAQRDLSKGRDLIQDTYVEMDVGPLPDELRPQIDEIKAAGDLAIARIRTLIDRYAAFVEAANRGGHVK